MKYVSTRDRIRTYTGAEAIVKGISDDGGLIVPSSFPVLNEAKFDALLGMDYPERAASVLHEYLDEFSFEELLDYANKAYSRFEGDDPCPLVKVDDGLYMLELWHGPTYAFKDMALTLLPHLMVASKRKLGDASRTLILVATSGDTGKAALEGSRSSSSIPRTASARCRRDRWSPSRARMCTSRASRATSTTRRPR